MIFDDKGVFGFDVSFYQAVYNQTTRTWTHIDFQKMKDYGASFVIIKCGQDSYLDATFNHNWQEAKRIGIPRASYWFLDQDNQAQEQARIYWNAVKDDPGEGPLVVDYEFGSGGMWFVLYDFIAELQKLSGYPSEKIWIYTGYFYWLEHRPQTLAQRAFFSQYPLWLAYYTNRPEDAKCPSDWEEPVLWQEGTPAIGLAAGAQSIEIDRNRLNGNDLAKHFSGVSPTPPTPLPTGTNMPITFTGRTLEGNSNVRAQADTSAALVRTLTPNTAFTAQGEKVNNDGFDWLNTVTPVAGWIALTSNIQYEPVTPPPNTITVKHTIDVYTDGSVKLDGNFIP